MIDQRRRKYLAKLAAKLRDFYTAQHQEQEANIKLTATEKVKSQLDGFMEAGLISQLVNKADLQKALGEAHFEVFKKTRDERRKQLTKETGAKLDWSIYDEPTIFRKID